MELNTIVIKLMTLLFIFDYLLFFIITKKMVFFYKKKKNKILSIKQRSLIYIQ